MEATCSEEQFIALFTEYGAAGTAKRLGIGVRRVYDRRKKIEQRTGLALRSPNELSTRPRSVRQEQRIHLDVDNGIVLVGSDAHIRPGPEPTAWRAFVIMAKRLKPKVLVLNGDVLDLGAISRHARIGWEQQPTVADEIEVAKDRLAALRKAVPKDCKLVWPLGNHDARFETRIANMAPEYARVNGVHLHDHFPHWSGCWACWINDSVVIKHRFRGGIHAAWNNTLHAGKSIVTGHTHSLLARPMSDYNGTRFGIETGTLADVYGEHTADYTEDGPANQRAGFAVLTFHEGTLLWPEFVHVLDEVNGLVEWRGEVIEV